MSTVGLVLPPCQHILTTATPIDPDWARNLVTSPTWTSRTAKGALGATPAPGITGPCWIWTGSIMRRGGYGTIKAGTRNRTSAHRIALVAKLGRDIEPGKVAGHLCHDLAVAAGLCHPDLAATGPCYHRRCVNPDHLEEMTPKENAFVRKNRGPLQQTPPPDVC